jgi:hypothetical protein
MTDTPRDTNSRSTAGDQVGPGLGNGEAVDGAAIGNGHDPNAGQSTPETRKAMLKAALQYAASGMQVFPGKPGLKESHKSARFSNGKPWGRTDDPVEIKRDWMRWPNANVCIAMGPDSGYFVLEVDTPQGHDVDGFASLKALEDAHEPLPETRQAISPSGSIHYYFKWPQGATIRNSASSIGPGIDIRGEGGMVLAPPSIKPDVGEYKWHNIHQVVDAPQWLLDLVADTTRTAERTPSGNAQASVAKVAAALEVIPNNTRDWEYWNRVGMAVWAATSGHELAFEAFDNWSKKNPVYNSHTTRAKWDAFSTTPITSIGAGSVFYMAYDADPEWRDRFEAAAPRAGDNSSNKLPIHIRVAEAFLAGMASLGKALRVVPDSEGRNHFWVHHDGLWSLLPDAEVAKWLEPELQIIMIELGYKKKSTIKMISEAARHVIRSQDIRGGSTIAWDAHGKIPTLDGLIDPITLASEPLKPEHFATWRLDLHYNAVATCPHWNQMLQDAFADKSDEDRKTTIELLQELFGMALIDNKPKSLCRAGVLFGGTDSGKSEILFVNSGMLCDNPITTKFAELEGAHGLQAFMRRAPWILHEAFNATGWHVSDVTKSIISGDPLSINPKGIKPITLKINAPAFWGTNHPSKFKEPTGAMAMRMEIIEMTQNFDRKNPIGVAAEARRQNLAWAPHDLILNTEKPGVFNWMLIGAQRALRRGHFINTKAGEDLIEQAKDDSNIVAGFIKDCVSFDITKMISTTDFYAAVVEWWKEHHGDDAKPPSPRAVGGHLAALRHPLIAQNKDIFKKRDGKRFYLGIVLNEAGTEFFDAAVSASAGDGGGGGYGRRWASNSSARLSAIGNTSTDIPAEWQGAPEVVRVKNNAKKAQEKRELTF